MSRRPSTTFVASLAVAFAVSCVAPQPPNIEGRPSAPARPESVWTPPPAVVAANRDARPTSPIITPAAAERLSLNDVVDIALRNSPVTRLSWAQARAAADVYGQTRGTLFPSVSLGGTALESNATNARGSGGGKPRLDFGPSVSLSYLLLDFGGRSANIDVARQTAIAADLAHNATIANAVLSVEGAAFNYLATRALRDAQQSAVDEARSALDAANARHDVGVSTVADVLQARTALSQAQLQLETLQGGLDVTRGSLASAMGLPASTKFDIPDVRADTNVRFLADSVDAYIAEAVRLRPELSGARAQAEAAASSIRVARAAQFPALSFSATGNQTNSTLAGLGGSNYSLNLGLQIPVFNGFGREYAVRSAEDQLVAARARTEQTRQQIELQVFTAYYGLRTATERVRTSEDLLASATESERVARSRYQEGVGSIIDLLVAQSALASARAQEVDARWVWRLSLAQLAHDVGTLSTRGEPMLEPAVR